MIIEHRTYTFCPGMVDAWLKMSDVKSFLQNS